MVIREICLLRGRSTSLVRPCATWEELPQQSQMVLGSNLVKFEEVPLSLSASIFSSTEWA